MSRSRASDWWTAVGVALFTVLVVIGIGFSVWARYYAPCHALGWMPVKDVPARCLTFVRQ